MSPFIVLTHFHISGIISVNFTFKFSSNGFLGFNIAMARIARLKSRSGFYHVISRGVNKQVLFENASDFNKYLTLLKMTLAEYSILCIAYCLMENHVHLLLRDPEGELSRFMHKLHSRYALYFNIKYGRTGHLFQERYKSEPIETDQYLLAAFRYILQNPEKAGIAPADMYRWNSYADYGVRNALTQTGCIEALIGDLRGLRSFMEHASPKMPSIPPYDFDTPGFAPVRTSATMREVLGTDDATFVQSLPKNERNRIILSLRAKGLSIRTIARKTGISRSIIQKIR